MRIEERLKASVSRHGADPAIVNGRTGHSYAELDLKAERLAAALQAGGITRGDRVAMFMDDGWEAAVSTFAVFKAGGVLAPVATIAAAGALSDALQRNRPLAVITQSRLAARVASAISAVSSVRLIVLAGGDRARAGGTCISFEEAVGRIGHVPPLSAAGSDDDPAVLFGEEAPLSHRQLGEDAAGAVIQGDGMAFPLLAERAGFARFLAAVDAGRTMVGRSLLAQEDDRRRSTGGARTAESRVGVLGLLDTTMAGGAPAFQR